MTASASGPSLLRGTSIVAFLTLLSRLCGFVRDLLTAKLFGTGIVADCFVVAFRIPNLLRSLVAEGALTSAFVPTFAGELKKGPEDAQSAISAVLAFLLLMTGLISLGGIVFAREIVTLFAPGFGDGTAKQDLCVLLTQIMFPYIVCVSIVAMLNGALNSVHIYGASAWAQVLMNIVLILGALAAMIETSHPWGAAIIMSASVVVGGLVQVWAQVPALRRAGFVLRLSFARGGKVIREILRLMLPAIFGAAVYQLSIFLGTLLASLQEQGAISWLFYADRVTQLPLGVFSIALASVLLPSLSRAHAEDNAAQFERHLVDSLRFTSFVMIPLSAVLFTFSFPITMLCFERGAFDAFSTLQTARAVAALSLSLWLVSTHTMLVRALIAKKDTVTPTLIGIASVLTYLLAAIVLMGMPISGDGSEAHDIVSQTKRFLQQFFPVMDFGHVGLSLGSVVSAAVSVTLVLLVVLLRYRVNFGAFVRATWKSLFASLAAVGSALLLCDMEQSALPPLAGGLLGGSIVFMAVHLVLRTREFMEMKNLLQRKIYERYKR